MNILQELILPFEQLRDAAAVDDVIDGPARAAVGFAFTTYRDLVNGANGAYERPVSDESMAATVDEKLFFAFAMADDNGLEDLATGIAAMRVALGLGLGGAL